MARATAPTFDYGTPAPEFGTQEMIALRRHTVSYFNQVIDYYGVPVPVPRNADTYASELEASLFDGVSNTVQYYAAVKNQADVLKNSGTAPDGSGKYNPEY